jgi:uncharacterized membrane protein
MPSEAPAVPRWAPPIAFVLCLVGLAVSAYLTWVHFHTGLQLSCPNTGRINCEKVTTSAESKLFGFFPVALAGLLYYAGMSVLCAPPLWRFGWAFRLRLLGVAAGVLMVLWLVYAEFVRIGAICLWCTSVHIVTFVLFVVVVVAWALALPPISEPDRPGTRARQPARGR